jgi:hypothetical protein
MPYYRKKRTPAEQAASEERRKHARAKIIKELKAYATQWKDPATKPAMEARAAIGRKSIAERKQYRLQALQRFMQRQEECQTKMQWLQTLGRGEETIIGIIRQMTGGVGTALRSKSPEHMFRTMVRDGILKVNLETGLWENKCKRL